MRSLVNLLPSMIISPKLYDSIIFLLFKDEIINGSSLFQVFCLKKAWDAVIKFCDIAVFFIKEIYKSRMPLKGFENNRDIAFKIRGKMNLSPFFQNSV